MVMIHKASDISLFFTFLHVEARLRYSEGWRDTRRSSKWKLFVKRDTVFATETFSFYIVSSPVAIQLIIISRRAVTMDGFRNRSDLTKKIWWWFTKRVTFLYFSHFCMSKHVYGIPKDDGTPDDRPNENFLWNVTLYSRRRRFRFIL